MKYKNLQILLGTIFTLASAGILIWVGLREETNLKTNEQQQIAAEIEVGAGLFENNCRGCHGLRGEGVEGLAPPLNNRGFFTNRVKEVGWQGSLKDYIVATVSTGRQVSTRPDRYPGAGSPAMPTWSERFGGPLRDDQIEAIATYIMNWESTAMGEVEITELPTPTPSAAELEDPIARGRIVYESSGCGACHTIDGLSNGVVGPNLTQIGTIAETRIPGMSATEYIKESIVNPSAYLVEGYDDLMLKTFGETLTEEQLSDLVEFLLAQK